MKAAVPLYATLASDTATRDLMTRILSIWSENCPEADDSYYKDGGAIQDFARGGWSEVNLTRTAYGTCI